MTEELVGKLGYLGIALILVLGGLGLPVPEEAPIILAAILSKSEKLWWPLALASCLTGVLLGDFIVYFIGFVYGEKVMSLRLTQKFLTRARETQIQGYFHRHGVKILILGRFAVGFRTAAYLTAGILKLPLLKLFLTDLFAATLSTCLMFGLGYVFAHQIQTSLDSAKNWLTAAVAVTVVSWLLYLFYKSRQRAGRAVGPRILDSADLARPLTSTTPTTAPATSAESESSVGPTSDDGRIAEEKTVPNEPVNGLEPLIADEVVNDPLQTIAPVERSIPGHSETI